MLSLYDGFLRIYRLMETLNLRSVCHDARLCGEEILLAMVCACLWVIIEEGRLTHGLLSMGELRVGHSLA